MAVGASTERTVALHHRFGAVGTYALAVNGVTAGTATVRERPGAPLIERIPAPRDGTRHREVPDGRHRLGRDLPHAGVEG